MNGYTDELESLLDDLGEFDERARPRTTVRTPTGRSSFQPRQAPSAASQSQVQAAARNLDSKIETLSNAVKALETRTNTITADVEKTMAGLRKEFSVRQKGSESLRSELQQTKLMSVLLPMLTTETVKAQDPDGKEITVVTQSQNQFASFLPFLLLMGGGMGGGGGDSSKGPLGDSSTLFLLLLLGRK